MIRQLRLSLVILPLAALAACNENEVSEAPAQAVHVATIRAAADLGYTAASSYTGRVEARLESQPGFEIGGLMASVSGEEGGRVEKGAELARLDTARLGAERAEALAALEQVRADLELATVTLTRTEGAFDFKGVSEQQLDEARQRVAALEAAEAVAAARLDRIAVDIDKATLRAPYAGTVVRRFVDPGAVVAAGQPVFDLQSSTLPEARIGVSPEASGGLATGERYMLSINDRPIEAELKAIVPRRDEQTRTLDAIFVIGDPEAVVRPGDLARLDVERFVAEPGFWVPVAALTEGPRGLWQGLVAEGDGDRYVLAKRTLEVLHADEHRAYVRGTLASGDLVVSEGIHRVVAGQVVRVDDAARLASAGEQGGSGP
jgi:RND family efflux transporter MFP subunit